MKRPIFERLQDLLFKFDLGMGIKWFRLGGFLFLVLLIILVYTGTQFVGLRDRETMDLGQLGRNLSMGRGYVTRNIRPIDVSYLTAAGKLTGSEGRVVLPELWTPPVYPLVLAGWFKVLHPQSRIAAVKRLLDIPAHKLPVDWPKLQALYDAARVQTLRMDRLLVILAWLFFVADLGVLYLLAQELFDKRVALLSVVLCMLCDQLLDGCVAGSMLPFLALLVLLVMWTLVKAEQWVATKESVYWVTGALVMCGILMGVATLTRYTMVCLLPAVAIWLLMTMPTVQRLVKFGVCFGAFLLVLLPWVAHNVAVADSPFGLARWATMRIMPDERGEETAIVQLQRQSDANTPIRLSAIGIRALMHWDKLYREQLKDTGANFLFAFFLVALLHRFRRDDAVRLHWWVVGVLLTALFCLGLAGPPQWNFFTIFIPVIAMYGAAFFFVMFERLQFRKRWARRSVVGLFVGLNVFPMLFTLLPPPPVRAYPPYDGGVVAATGETFRESDLVATDIPWALAWYSDRSAMLIPVEEQAYLHLNDNLHVFAGIYLTRLREWRWMEALTTYSFWLSKYDVVHPPPEKAPLQYRRQITVDGEQILWSDTPR
ncbi:MAG: glycosyltransferase family 39 protein [Verrucomicrobiota bacterium]